MKKNTYQAFAVALSITFIITPLFASAQTVDASSSTSTQIQSLISEITALETQLRSLLTPIVSSSSMMMPGMASSTPMWGNGGGMGAMRCLPIMRDLSEGSSGSDVSSLQQMLSADGFLSASSTGFFGPLTARAVARFQTQFGITASSTGAVGPLTRDFLRGGCGIGQGPMGSSTAPMWQPGASTSPWGMNGGTSTGQWIPQMMGHGMGPGMNQMGSSTMPQPPCMPQDDDDQNGTSSLDNAAAAAAALFIPHVLIPGMMQMHPPCPEVSGEMQQ